MSYILDALQKSERKRQRDSVPDLQTVHNPEPLKKRKGPLWAWLLVATLMITVVLLVLYLPGRQHDNYLTVPDPSAIEKPAASQPRGSEIKSNEHSGGRQVLSEIDTVAADHMAESISATRSTELYEEMEISSADVPGARPSPLLDPSSPNRLDNANRSDSRDEETMSSALDDTSSSSPAPELIADVIESDGEQSIAEIPVLKPHLKTENEIPLLTSLPQSLRQGIPEMTISYHVFTQNPATRLVSINGRIVRQGQEVTQNLTLEEITAAGVVLNYQGKRFRLEVF